MKKQDIKTCASLQESIQLQHTLQSPGTKRGFFSPSLWNSADMSQSLESHMYQEKLSAVLYNAEVSFDTKLLIHWFTGNDNEKGGGDGNRAGSQ